MCSQKYFFATRRNLWLTKNRIRFKEVHHHTRELVRANEIVILKYLQIKRYVSNYEFVSKGTVSWYETGIDNQQVTGKINRRSGTWILTMKNNRYTYRARLLDDGGMTEGTATFTASDTTDP